VNAPRLLALAALAVPLAASAADFEGLLESRMTGPHASGTAKLWVSKVGARMEMDMAAAAPAGQQGAQHPIRMVTLHKKAEPDLTYLLNVEQKTYAVLDAREAGKMAAGTGSDETWSVKKLGGDKVAGLPCEKALVTSSRGREFELCSGSGILAGSGLLEAMERRSHNSLLKALHDAGLKGFPLRWIQKVKEGTTTWEVVRAHRESVPASTFEIPAGYQKKDLLGAMTTPEQQRKMDEAMKKMTPEQRQKMEEMMKRYQGGK
jgi:hypothetical protein